MKWITVVFTLVLPVAIQANDSQHESLEKYCLAIEADTAANCACGQKKADELLTKEEQQLLIRFMMEDPTVMPIMKENPAKAEALLEKLAEVTKGCQA